MIPEDRPFEGLEPIPGLQGRLDSRAEPAYLRLRGDCPIVLVAPHAGSLATTPRGARAFGERTRDPVTGSSPTRSDDTNTLFVAFGIVRRLAAMGFTPHVFINLVSRRFMDLNRGWSGQIMWRDALGETRPADETLDAAAFPRVESFRRFKQSYYQDFHDDIGFVTSTLHPNGWLFDLHGRSFTELDDAGAVIRVIPGDLIAFTAYGHYARRDVVHAGTASLVARLLDNGFGVHPAVAGPQNELAGADGRLITNMISGSRFGASNFDPARDPVPRPDNVTPTAPHRVHGVQFELAQSLRNNQPPEALESVGLRMADAIHACLLGNGVLARAPQPRDGAFAAQWFGLLG